MRDELEILYAIDLYLRGELHGDKLLAFEERLKSDPSLLKEIELQKSVNLLVHGVAYQEIRKQIKTDLKEIDFKKKIRNRFIISFSVLIFLLVGYFGVFYNKSIIVPSANKLPLSKDTLFNKLNNYNLKPKVDIEPDSIKKLKSLNNSGTFNSKPGIQNRKSNSTPSEEFLNSKSNDSEKVAHNNFLSDKKENPKLINDHAMVLDSSITMAKVNPSELLQDKVRTSSEVVNCRDIFISAQPTVEATCSDVSDGKILFTDMISGGNKPYQISFNTANDFSDKTEFYSLGKGVYLFYIRDFKGCTSKIEVSVGEKNCKPNKFIINTTIGESWIVSEGNLNYTLKIYNKSGREILKKSSKEMPSNEWRGEDNYGNILDSGLYIYIIEYTNGQIDNGQISIVR